MDRSIYEKSEGISVSAEKAPLGLSSFLEKEITLSVQGTERSSA